MKHLMRFQGYAEMRKIMQNGNYDRILYETICKLICIRFDVFNSVPNTAWIPHNIRTGHNRFLSKLPPHTRILSNNDFSVPKK